MRCRLPADRDAAVVRDVEQLVAVRRPRVEPGKAAHVLAHGRRGGREQHDRTVDVDPGRVAARTVGVGQIRNGVEIVERAGVDVARLHGDDRGTRRPAQDALQFFREDSVLLVAGGQHRGALPEAQESQGPGDRRVGTFLEDDGHPRRSQQSVDLDVPAGLPKHLVTGSGQAREVGHLPSGDEADGASRGQPEDVEQHLGGQFLGDRHTGRGREEPGVLVPCRDEQLRAPRRRVQAADHESEEPAAGVRGDVGAEVADQVGHDRGRVHAPITQAVVEGRPDLGVRAPWVDGPVGQRLQMCQRRPTSDVQHGLPVRTVHDVPSPTQAR